MSDPNPANNSADDTTTIRSSATASSSKAARHAHAARRRARFRQRVADDRPRSSAASASCRRPSPAAAWMTGARRRSRWNWPASVRATPAPDQHRSERRSLRAANGRPLNLAVRSTSHGSVGDGGTERYYLRIAAGTTGVAVGRPHRQRARSIQIRTPVVMPHRGFRAASPEMRWIQISERKSPGPGFFLQEVRDPHRTIDVVAMRRRRCIEMRCYAGDERPIVCERINGPVSGKRRRPHRASGQGRPAIQRALPPPRHARRWSVARCTSSRRLPAVAK